MDLGRVRLGHDHDQLVRRERDRLAHEAVVIQELRILRARGCVDVGRSALPDLQRQLVGPREAVAWGWIDPRKDIGQRRRGVDRQAVAGAPGARERKRDKCEEGCERSHRSTMIEVALTTAVAESPGSRASSSAASRVITDTILKGPASSSTWASNPSTFTSRTV